MLDNFLKPFQICVDNYYYHRINVQLLFLSFFLQILKFLNFLVNANVLSSETCPAHNITNGRVEYSHKPVDGRYPVYTKANITCDPGFVKNLVDQTYCGTVRPGMWNFHNFRCDGKIMIFFLIFKKKIGLESKRELS